MQSTTQLEKPQPGAVPRPISAAHLQQRLARIALYTLLAVAAVIFFVPFYWVVTASFKSSAELRAIPPTWWPHEFTLTNYPLVWDAKFARYFLNSFIYSGGTTVVVVFTSTLLGYVIVKDASRLGNMIFWFLLAASMVPFVTYLLPLFNMLLRLQDWLRIPMINTYWGMILPWVIFPFGVFLMRQAMFSVPNDLLDAARIDGATEFGIFSRIVMPLTRHNVAALAIIVFIFKYDDLIWPLVVAQRTEMYPVTVGLVEYVGQFFVEYHLYTTASVLVMLPIFVLYLFLQRYIIEGVAMQGLKG
jgi:multiple sugar transport system permease protein